jgi:type II secretory pathway component PulJ
MLTPPDPSISRVSDASGFTLIETLVAMISSTVVVGALFAIFIVALHQTARTSGRVEATELGNTTMTRLVDELHSACIVREFTPIREKSNANELIFVSGVGTEALLGKAYLHRVVYSESEHTLVEKTWPNVSTSSWPGFEFSESGTPTTVRIGEHITQDKAGSEAVPVFQYYGYAKNYNSTNAVSTLETTPLEDKTSAGLEKANAAKAAAVFINFTAGASQYKQYNPTIELSNQVTLAFTAPTAETPILQKPCE